MVQTLVDVKSRITSILVMVIVTMLVDLAPLPMYTLAPGRRTSYRCALCSLQLGSKTLTLKETTCTSQTMFFTAVESNSNSKELTFGFDTTLKGPYRSGAKSPHVGAHGLEVRGMGDAYHVPQRNRGGGSYRKLPYYFSVAALRLS